MDESRGRPRRSRVERGAVVIMVSLLIIPLCIVTATVVDLGFVRIQRASLQNAVDSAAVAAGNQLSSSGSGVGDDDGLPRSACIQALASLRQNIPDFTAADVDDAGGCAGNLPDLVSACVDSGAATPVTLTATAGDVTAELTYPIPDGLDRAGHRVTYVRSGSETSDPNSPDARCRAMLVSVRRSNIGPFFTGLFNGSGQSVSAQSLGVHLDPGYVEVTIPPTTSGPTTTTSSTTTTTLPPSVGANFLLQHTIAGSDCASIIGVPNAEAPYFVPNLDTPYATKLTMKNCTNIFSWVQAQVWTAYGFGSNGLGTVVVVGDQDRFARFTGCSTSNTLNAGDIVQTTEGWVGEGVATSSTT